MPTQPEFQRFTVKFRQGEDINPLKVLQISQELWDKTEHLLDQGIISNIGCHQTSAGLEVEFDCLPDQVEKVRTLIGNLLEKAWHSAETLGHGETEKETTVYANKEEELLARMRKGEYVDWKDVPDELWQKREFVRVGVQRFPSWLRKATEELKDDKEIVLSAVRQYGNTLQYASDRLKDDKEVALVALRAEHRGVEDAMEHMSPRMFEDRTFMLEAVGRTRRKFRVVTHSSSGITEDKSCKTAIAFAAPELLMDRDFILDAAKRNGWGTLKELPLSASDPEMLRAAIEQDPFALEHAGPFSDEKEIVMKAVQKGGCALEFASSILKADREIVETAVRQDGNALYFADSQYLEDREIVLAALQNGFSFMQGQLPNALNGDKEIILLSLEKSLNTGFPVTLQDVSNDLKDDKGFVLKMVQIKGWNLEFASERLRGDKEIVRAALKKCGQSFRFANKELRGDRELLNLALQHYDLDTLSPDPQECPLFHASQALRSDANLIRSKLHIASAPKAAALLQAASENVKNRKDIALAALQAVHREIQKEGDEARSRGGIIHINYQLYFSEILENISPELHTDYDVQAALQWRDPNVKEME